MNDLWFSIIKIAGITLLITFLWAITLGVAYWDIQRRKQSGQQINTLAWMAVVAFIPFIGLVGYFAARLVSPPAKAGAQTQPGAQRETKFKRAPQAENAPVIEPEPAPAAKQALPTIRAAEINNAAAHNQQNTVRAARPPVEQFQFSVTHGPELGKTFLIDQLPAQIGRDLDSAIRLDGDTGVSRKHALVYQINGALRIRDLKSTHGTRVNGEAVADKILTPGDQIDVGLTRLTFQQLER